MPPQITIIGLGDMGAALASAFLKKGYKTTVWNRSPERATSLVEAGAIQAPTVTEAVEASSLAIICLLNSDAVLQTLQKASTSWAGRTIVDLTNGTPEQSRHICEWVTAHDAKYIHGGIMTVPRMIGRPEAVTIYSGPTASFESAKADISVLGTGRYVGEDAELASLYDNALLAGMAGLFSGFIHATALIRTADIKATDFIDSLLVPSLNGIMPHLRIMAKQVDSGKYESQSNLAMQLVGLRNIIDTTGACGVSAEFVRPLEELIKRRIEQGGEKDGIASLVDVAKKLD